MRGFFKLAFSVSILSLVAFAAPACGGDDDDGGTGGTAATGGGGGGSGGTGGTGATDGGGGVTCGTNSCDGFKIGGLLPMAACCAGAASDACGGNVDKTLAGLLGNFPEGCYELNQPGAEDCGCPTLFFTSPLDNSAAQFNGCCTSTGECGYNVDISSKAGPNFGCVPLTKLGATAAVPCTVGSETPPPASGDCPNPDAGAAGAGGTAGSGSGGTAGAATDAGTD